MGGHSERSLHTRRNQSLNTIISIEPYTPMERQLQPGHNRWHPDIPPLASVHRGERFRVECPDMLDWQIENNDDARDIAELDMDRTHMVSGPIAVEGAMPGDLLVVDILDIGPLSEVEWGYTGIMRPEMGGILSDRFSEPRKAIWDLNGIYAESRHIPGVRFAGQIHPGIVTVAPSHELLGQWNERERALIDTNPDRVPELATEPKPQGALLGTLEGDDYQRAAEVAARTLPARENGGNCDIKNLSKGSRLYMPVFVEGANLSVGDIHFSLADGEVTVCGAIEMAGYLDLRVDVIPNGMQVYGTSNPFFVTGPLNVEYTERIVFEGLSLETDGGQRFLDPRASYRQAVLEAISYLTRFGYSAEQAYVILSTAPIDGRISAMGGKPNAVCSLALPTGIFDGDIKPEARSHWRAPQGKDLARVLDQ
jgi:formamidase